MKKLLIFLLLSTASIMSVADTEKGNVPADFNPDYFSNHTENIWLFPDWPFYKPVGIRFGDTVQVADNPDFSNYTEGVLWSATIESDYDLVYIGESHMGFNMPANHSAWPVYRLAEYPLKTFTYIRMSGAPDVPDPVITDPADPVQPDPVDGHGVSRQAQTGFLNQISNILTGTKPEDVAQSHANMLKDKVNKQQVVDSIRDDLKELTELRKKQ